MTGWLGGCLIRWFAGPVAGYIIIMWLTYYIIGGIWLLKIILRVVCGASCLGRYMWMADYINI